MSNFRMEVTDVRRFLLIVGAALILCATVWAATPQSDPCPPGTMVVHRLDGETGCAARP